MTLIVAFEMVHGRCPQPARDDHTGLPVSPHDAAFDEPGVSTVWKRLYEPYCEMQLLFEDELGQQLLAK